VSRTPSSPWLRIAARIIFIASVAAGAMTPQAQAPARSERPRLVVFVVVDQFRVDYVSRYSHQWTRGLKRLFEGGAVFPLAAYPYSGTVTCPGHATISTGSFPATHGLIGNSWFDRERGANVSCTHDDDVTSLPFGGATGTERHSPGRLRANAFADELRLQAVRPPRIVTVSLKARSAITLAGRGGPGTLAVWEEDNGTWATSSTYAATPAPEIDWYAKANPVTAAYGKAWNRLLPESAYLFTDVAPGEPRAGTFPHALTSPSGAPDNDFVTLWERSPFSDDAVADIAIAALNGMKLGQMPGTDMLGVSFSALDLVGHAFGPNSHEVQDTLARLDVTLGRLLDALDTSVGRDRYVLALSADHGVAPIPEQVQPSGVSAGRLVSANMRRHIDEVIDGILGPGTHVAALTSNQVYLTPGTYHQLEDTAHGLATVMDAIRQIPGVWKVYAADELAGRGATSDGTLAAARLSHFQGRSGDVLIIPQPYWFTQSTGTTHGTPHGYDQRVPVLFTGAGIRPGQYYVTASPADIAPTLAELAGIVLAHADGRVLADAIAR